MLLSGAGLIGVLVFNLVHEVTMAESRAAFAATRQADFTATALRRMFRAARFLDEVPATCRFTVNDGSVLVPPSIGWLEPPALPRREDVDVLVREKLEQIAQANDPAAARQLLQKLLDDGSALEEHRHWLIARAAWFAHQNGQVRWRDVLLGKLDATNGGHAPAAAVLLHATVNSRLPAWATARIPTLPEALARPLLRRLREKGLRTDEFAAGLTDAIAHRQTLSMMQHHLPALRGVRAPIVRALDDHLLVFHGDPSREGQGALLSRGVVLECIANLEGNTWVDLPADSHRTLATAPDETAITVIPDLIWLRPRAVPRQGVGGAWLVGLLVLALALVSGAGLSLLYRSLRREAEAAHTRSEFLTMVTHELKTPLAGIRLLAEMLQDGHVRGEEQHRDYYARLSSESVRLSMLIENVLDLGRMERGERAYDFVPVELTAVVDEAVALFRPIARPTGLQIRVRPDVSTGSVRGDRHALLQALLNVMDNARKYAAAGEHLDVAVENNGGTCHVAIRDYGPGIPESEREAVFERFHRGVRHRNGSVPGVGLGLYLAHTIVADHGGDLRVAAPADGGPGVCFRLTLPSSELDEAEAG